VISETFTNRRRHDAPRRCSVRRATFVARRKARVLRRSRDAAGDQSRQVRQPPRRESSCRYIMWPPSSTATQHAARRSGGQGASLCQSSTTSSRTASPQVVAPCTISTRSACVWRSAPRAATAPQFGSRRCRAAAIAVALVRGEAGCTSPVVTRRSRPRGALDRGAQRAGRWPRRVGSRPRLRHADRGVVEPEHAPRIAEQAARELMMPTDGRRAAPRARA